MLIKPSQIAGCMLVLHLIYSPAYSATIGKIVIQGNRHISEEKIRRIIQLETGDVYDDQKLSAALKRLFGTKEFADLKARKDERGGQVIVTIEVKEYEKIDAVEFKGNKHVKEEDLRKAISINKGTFVRPGLLRKDRSAIEELYKEKGYYSVSVEAKVESNVKEKKSKKTRTVLMYTIDEGEKVSIKHIDFFGNRQLTSDAIRKVMDSKEDRWYRGADFKPKSFEEDMEKIRDLYQEHGFLDFEVKNKELIFSENGKNLDIFITVQEGTQYQVGAVTWSGNQIIDDQQIGSMIVFERGDVFNNKKFKDIQFAVNSLYWDRGYIYNSVTPVKKVKGKVVDVEFEIVEGNPAHIREINVVGNTKTSEKVIRRELVVAPGDVFLRPRLIRSLREVFNLGFFKGPPQVSTSPPHEDGDIDITLRVDEKQTGQFRMGAGFSQLNSLSGFLGLSETNFLGKGQQVGVEWEFSRFRQTVDLRFAEPWLFGTPTELSLNVFNRIQNQVRQQFYDDRRKGFSIRLGRPFPWYDYTSVQWRYLYQSVELKNFSPLYTGPLLSIQWPQNTSSMSLTLMRNSTDSPFHPTAGTMTFVTAELNGGLLGGDVKFQRYESGISWYETLFWKFVLEMKYRAGVLDGYTSPSQVPDYELFRLGGNRRYGVRGYDYFEIVPEGNPEFQGGRFMQTLSYEITWPIAPTVYGLFFFEGGNTWNSFQGADLFDLRKGAGVGIRIELPMIGTVGFDYGYGIDKVGGASWEPHFSLGAGF